ncbi:MAG: hypothetical protein AB7U25_24380 [Vicinamibacterales bacterium]
MRSVHLTAVGVATLAGAMTLTAQTPSTTPPATSRSSAPDITVTGCLKTWTSGMDTAHGKAASPATAADAMTDSRYMLIVSESSASMPAVNPSSPAHPQVPQYVVTAGAGLNLAGHVGHTVRVTGTVQQAHAAESARSDAPRPAPGRNTEGSDHAWSTLSATSMAMVSASCDPQS